MKKFLAVPLLLTASLLAVTATSAPAAVTVTASGAVPGNEYTVVLDGKTLTLDTPPELVNGSMTVPLRNIAEAAGAAVKWDQSNYRVTAAKDGVTVVMAINSREASKNGRYFNLAAPPELKKDVTMVPLRFFSEAFGYIVKWDGIGKKVTIDNGSDLLPAVGSQEKLDAVVREAAANGDTGMYSAQRARAEATSAGSVPAAATSASPTAGSADVKAAAPAAAPAADHSSTNVQVEGVDEADIVKTDGEYLYQVNRDKVMIVKAEPAADMNLAATLSFDNQLQPREIYVDDKYLVVIGTSYGGPAMTPDGRPTGKMAIRPGTGLTKAIVYDIASKENVKKLREIELDGDYISSRKIGSSLYLMANRYVDSYGIMNGSAGTPVPLYRDSAVSADFSSVGYDRIRYVPGTDMSAYLIAAGVDLDQADSKADVNAYLGAGQNVYASESNLYVAATNYAPLIRPAIAGGPALPAAGGPAVASPISGAAGGPAAAPAGSSAGGPAAAFGSNAAGGPAAASGSGAVGSTGTVAAGSVGSAPAAAGSVSGVPAGAPTPSVPAAAPAIRIGEPAPGSQPEQTTEVLKFRLDQGRLLFAGSGKVPGRVFNQFAMDESDGYFRIATTTGEEWRTDEFTSKNNVYVLDESLAVTGRLEGLAPGEKIYSVRFMGSRAYMVTYRTVDPLFVLDLTNPQAPRVLGSLKIPGYSDYLQPYDDTHVIGFGKDSVELSAGAGAPGSQMTQAFYQGMKIAIFDVSDVSRPVEMFKESIGDRGTDSELLHNHKALLFDKERGLMAFPVTVMKIKEGAGELQGIPAYGQFAFQGAYVYNVSLSSGFTLKGTITHLSDADLANSGNNWYNSEKNIQRIVSIKNNLFTLSPAQIRANDSSTLAPVGRLDLPVSTSPAGQLYIK